MKVLIADDSALIRQRVGAALREIHGTEIVAESPDGLDALIRFDQTRPDLVVLDIAMPGRSGIQVADEIRRRNKAVKIVILTNYATEQHRRKCFELGVDFFLSKSDGVEVLSKIVSGLKPSMLG